MLAALQITSHAAAAAATDLDVPAGAAASTEQHNEEGMLL